MSMKSINNKGAAMVTYEDRVRQLEAEGCTTSDAQSVADVEVAKGVCEADCSTHLSVDELERRLARGFMHTVVREHVEGQLAWAKDRCAS